MTPRSLSLAIALIIVAAPAARAAPVVLGPADTLNAASAEAGVSMDARGTGHFAWVDPGQRTVSYCEIQAGGNACVARQKLPIIAGSEPSQSVFSLRVWEGIPRTTIVLGLCCETAGRQQEELLQPDGTGGWLTEALPGVGGNVVDFGTDTGFGGGDVQFAPNGREIWVLGSSGNTLGTQPGVQFQIDAPTGTSTTPFPISGPTGKPFAAFRIGALPNGAPFVLGTARASQSLTLRVANGHGTFGGWVGIQGKGPANTVYGSGGSWLLDAHVKPGSQRAPLILRRITSGHHQPGHGQSIGSVATYLLPPGGGSSTRQLDQENFPAPFEDPAGGLHVVWTTVGADGCGDRQTCLVYLPISAPGALGTPTVLDTDYADSGHAGQRDFVAANANGDGWVLTLDRRTNGSVVALARPLRTSRRIHLLGGQIAALLGPRSPATGTSVTARVGVSNPGLVSSVAFGLGSVAIPSSVGAAMTRSPAGRVVVHQPPFVARLRLPRRVHGRGVLCDVRYRETLTATITTRRGRGTIRDTFIWCPPVR